VYMYVCTCVFCIHACMYHADMCEKTLRDEGFTDEELQDETAVLLVQTAYVLQLQNEEDQAFNIYTDVLNRK